MAFGRSGWVHGSTITKDGGIRFASVSQLEQADSCPLKWWFEKVKGFKPPEKEWQTTGKEVHAEFEDYLKHGNKNFGIIAAAGFHMLPEPGPDLDIERDLLVPLTEPANTVITAETSPAYLAKAPLKAAGIPVLGQFDCAHTRRTNKGTSDIEDTLDPEGTVEVIDWKTTSDFKWSKTGVQLLHSIQMSGYGKWWLNQRPDLKYVRLSHGNLLTRGRPQARKVTILVKAEQIHESWEHAEGVARLMVQTAKATDAKDVPYKLDACDKYGGCHHRKAGHCTAGQSPELKQVLASLGTRKAIQEKTNPEKVIPVGSLLKTIKKTDTPKTDPDASAIALAKAKLEAEEKAGILAARIPAGFSDICAKIEALSVGFPTLTGKAAQASAALKNSDVPESHEIPGVGQYGYVKIDDPALMYDLYTELAEAAQDSASPLPPDAPLSVPELAAQVDEVPVAVVPEPVKAPKTKETKTKEIKTPPVQVEVELQMSDSDRRILDRPPITNGLWIFIDTIPSVPFTDLYTWSNDMAKILTDTLGKTEKGSAVDIRSAGVDSALGYSKWEGVLFGMIVDPELSPLPDGAYYIDTRGSRVREIIADALKSRASLYARSAR